MHSRCSQMWGVTRRAESSLLSVESMRWSDDVTVADASPVGHSLAMSFAERVAKASDRFYDRMRKPEARDVATAAATGSLDQLNGHKYCVVVTYKRNAEAVPSPLWFGTGRDKLHCQTGGAWATAKP